MKERNYSLDLIKILATITIIFHHYQQATGLFFEGHLNFFHGRFYFGIVVELFFEVSGFLMFTYIDKIRNGLSFGEYFKRRFIRFFPMVVIGAVGYEAFVVILNHVRLPDVTAFSELSLWGMITDFFMVQSGGALPNPMINNPTWYISVLMICYVAFYLIVWLADRLRVKPWYMFAAMVFLGLGIQTYGINLPFLNGISSRGFIGFFLGVLLAWGLKHANWKINRREHARSVVCAGVMVFLVVFMVLKWQYASDGYKNLTIFLFYPSLIILLNDSSIAKALHFRWIGEIAKGTFCAFILYVDLLVVLFCINGARGGTLPLQTAWMMLLFAFVTMVIGIVVHYLVEEPINHRIDLVIRN